MAKRHRSRLVAQQLVDDTAEVNDVDYFGKFTMRKRPKNDSKDQNPESKASQPQDERAARIARREAAKLGQAQGIRGQGESSRQGTPQPSEEGSDSGDERGTAAEDDDEGDEDGSQDGVDLARITMAMNQARNRTMKPTINGIGSRRPGQRTQDTEVSSGDGHDCQEELVESHSRDGQEAAAPPSPNDRPRSRRVAEGKKPQQKNQRNQNGRGRQNAKEKIGTSSLDEDESEAESQSETNDEVAEDTAFVEPLEQDEEAITVKVVINSMGGILKTLQHAAWTGSTQWARELENDDQDDGQTMCETSAAKALKDEIRGLNSILEDAANGPEEPFDKAHDPTSTTPYLRTKSLEIQQHIIRIDQKVNKICTQGLSPVSTAGNARFEAHSVKRRQELLRDISRQLIPMLIMTVKNACGICPSEDNISRTTLYLNCFRLQFFLRPLAWADRLHKALIRGLEQWPGGHGSHDGADDDYEGGREAEAAGKKARSTLGSQLGALYSAVRNAEGQIQQTATQAERQELEAEIERQERERREERQREIAARKQREQEKRDRKDAEAFQAFFDATRALRSQPDPLKQLWDQDQATLPPRLRAINTVRATQGADSSSQGQRNDGEARSRRGPSRRARVESVSDSSDPFDPNYRPRSKTPEPTRHKSGTAPRPNPPSGLGSSQQARNASRPWIEEEQKAMIKAIRYKRNYDVSSMAQKLRRSEADVAKMAALLKRGYREAYTQKGLETPAWAL